MRVVLIVLGVLCLLIGAVWILQGTYVLTQGFMAGQTRWAVIGGVVAAVGLLLLILGAKRRKRPPAPDAPG